MTIEQHSVPSFQDQYDVYIALYCLENASFQNFIEKLRSQAPETRTCHWGFDSANWAAYIQVTADDDGAHFDYYGNP